MIDQKTHKPFSQGSLRHQLLARKEQYEQRQKVIQDRKMSTKVRTEEMQCVLLLEKLSGLISFIDELLNTDFNLSDEVDLRFEMYE